MAAPCQEERQRQASRQMCKRVRSVIAISVLYQTRVKLNVHLLLHVILSGQLRNLGVILKHEPQLAVREH